MKFPSGFYQLKLGLEILIYLLVFFPFSFFFSFPLFYFQEAPISYILNTNTCVRLMSATMLNKAQVPVLREQYKRAHVTLIYVLYLV